MKFNRIETERLFLLELTLEKMEEIFRKYSDKEAMSILKYPNEKCFFEEKDRCKGGYTRMGTSWKMWQLVDKATDEAVGCCGFHTWRTVHQNAEMGYWLYEDRFKGIGYMSEAIHGILNFGYECMNLHRVEAHVGPNNKESQNIMRKFNFVKEGQMREDYKRNGVLEDSVMFSLLSHEFLY